MFLPGALQLYAVFFGAPLITYNLYVQMNTSLCVLEQSDQTQLNLADLLSIVILFTKLNVDPIDFVS